MKETRLPSLYEEVYTNGVSYKFRDPLYGFIGVNNLEYQVIKSRWFQRLRRIKQLGFTNLTYPSAEHTRFEHSLGVMEVATRIFNTLVQKEPSLRHLQNNKKEHDHVLQVLRLAALLHDVGHPPFSHAGEELLPIKPIPTNRNGKRPQRKGRSTLRPPRRYAHEDYSHAIIHVLVAEKVIPNAMATAITDLFHNQKRFYGLRCIVSSQFDADRMDYLFRDSHHLGVNYGVFDLPMLIQSLTLRQTRQGPELAIEEEGLHVAEGMILARYYMFSQVYYHENNRSFEILLKEFLKAILPGGTFPAPVPHASLEAFYEWDDWRIQGKLYQPGMARFRDVFLLRKRPYIKIYETPVLYVHQNGNGLTKNGPSSAAKKEEQKLAKLIAALRARHITFEIDAAKKSIYQFQRDNLHVKTPRGFVPLSKLSNIIQDLPKQMIQKRIYIDRAQEKVGKRISHAIR